MKHKVVKVSIFNWNGNLHEDVKKYGEAFGITFTDLKDPCMGFELFKVEGPEEAVNEFMDFYELQESIID
jgi:hypothetical protein